MTTNTWNAPSGKVDELSARKLAAFERIEDEFIASFFFVQDVHGQRRFDAFPVEQSVRYLHALYICELKDRLLSVLKNIERYEGERCLQLLRDWQEGHSAEVIAFIHRKLDNLPFAEVSRQIEQSARLGAAQATRRLAAGRHVLLNRNFNLSYALDAIFALEPERLREDVSAACAQLGHTPEDVTRQIADLRSDIYAYAPSAPLAQRNMLVMNRLGMRMIDARGDRPGERADRVTAPASPAPPYAEEVIRGEMTLVSLNWVGGMSQRNATAESVTSSEPIVGSPPVDAAEAPSASDV